MKDCLELKKKKRNNPWSRYESFMVQEMAITSSDPAFESLKLHRCDMDIANIISLCYTRIKHNDKKIDK